jgi:hypothetical protein
MAGCQIMAEQTGNEIARNVVESFSKKCTGRTLATGYSLLIPK